MLGNLYSTGFNANNVVKFDTSGNLIGTFGTGYNCSPESIVLNAAGDLYIGQADCSRDVVHLSGSGTLIGTHDVPIERRGSEGPRTVRRRRPSPAPLAVRTDGW